MKKEKFTKFILMCEIVAIVLLHMSRGHNMGLKDIAKTKGSVVAPTLQMKPQIILPVSK